MIIGTQSIDGTPLDSLSKCSERKVAAKCDGCNADQVIIWANYRLSQIKRNFDGQTFCRKCKSAENLKKAHSVGPWNKGKRLPTEQRKGKSYITKDGYRAVFRYRFDRDHSSQWANYRKEHLVVMEEYLGRLLSHNEVVHHIDGDKLNNSIDNLWLTDSAGHRRAHASLQSIGYQMYHLGLLSFNRTTGQYELNVEVAVIENMLKEYSQRNIC